MAKTAVKSSRVAVPSKPLLSKKAGSKAKSAPAVQKAVAKAAPKKPIAAKTAVHKKSVATKKHSK